MLPRFSRRSFLGFALGGAATAAGAGDLSVSLRPQLRPGELYKKAIAGADAIIAKARLTGHVCYAVADLETGEIREGGNSDLGTAPASVAKAITALYSIDVLGAEYRFETRVLARGTISGGILDGDLILVGGGDPTLDTDDLAELASALKDAGLREVRGRFLVADGINPRIHSIDRGQPDHVGYSPAVAGIALNFNRVHFGWERQGKGYAVSMDARTARYRPEVSVARMRVEDRSAPIYTYKKGRDRDDWTVAKRALGSGGARWLPVRNPALYAGDVFQTLVRSHGIVLKRPVAMRGMPGGAVVATHQSAPLIEILQGMLRYSTNITAEMVGLAASRKRRGLVSSLEASANEMNLWAAQKLGVEGLALVDHSGLGSDSRMTASSMVRALVRAHQDGALRPILREVTMRDGQGRPDKSHPIRVRAKTGTLNFVSGLAGYMTPGKGPEMAFAIFAADEAIRARISRAERERPPGARGWNRKARALQQALIERWGAVYGS
ncbi:MAG: D-alanyl-D-alanine carboxypeptidase/D-alanyl-D-alanine-endopeptidase [Pseudomonadota bacterium]